LFRGTSREARDREGLCLWGGQPPDGEVGKGHTGTGEDGKVHSEHKTKKKKIQLVSGKAKSTKKKGKETPNRGKDAGV